MVVREQRVSAKLAREQRLFGEARRTVADDQAMRRVSGSSHTTGHRERGRFLDQQAGLPSSRVPRDGTPRRDYPALAGLAGYGREEYERLAPRARREARLRIDRELAVRSHHGVVTQEAGLGRSQLGSREPGRVDAEFDRALEQRVRVDRTSFLREPNEGSRSSLPEGDTLAGNETGWDVAHKANRPRSTVMDDARAVAERASASLDMVAASVSAGVLTHVPGLHGRPTVKLVGWLAAIGGMLGLYSLMLIAVLVGASGVSVGGESATFAVSERAELEIPARYLSFYRRAAQRYGLDWAILAGIGKVECDHGRDPDPSCTKENAVNSAGGAVRRSSLRQPGAATESMAMATAE